MTTKPTNPATFDHEGIKQLAEELGRPMKTLVALAPINDPFCLAPARQADAVWFAELWTRFGMGNGGHTRGLHYKLISQRTPIRMRDGMPYVNTDDCWKRLSVASKDARYLDLISVDDMVDRRNAAPITNIRTTQEQPVAFVSGGDFRLEGIG
jgi:hypothetical protein